MRKQLILTHIVSPMPEAEDELGERLPRIRKAFSGFYQIRDKDGSFFLINAEHITQIAAKQEGDDWHVTLSLADGTSHTVTSDWAENFIREVFGKAVWARQMRLIRANG